MKRSFLYNPVGTWQLKFPELNNSYLVLLPLHNLGAYFNSYFMYDNGMPSFTGGYFCHSLTVQVYWGSIAMYFFVFGPLFIIFFMLLIWIVKKIATSLKRFVKRKRKSTNEAV